MGLPKFCHTGLITKRVGKLITTATTVIGTLIFLSLFAGLLTAQEYRGRIQGTVRDSSDAVIAGATVTLLNVNTGVSTVRQTNETGHYIVDLVEPGSYSITIETPGFTKFVQSNVPLASRGDVTVDATLKTGDVRETVTVAAEASQVQFTTSKLETTVDTQIAKDIPQLYRSPFVLATLDPSVLKDDSNTEYNPFNSWGPGRMSVGGGANFSNDLQVDGARVGVSVKTGYVPSPDMVQEVNVSQNTVDAEFGHGSGSAISIVTKGGTNQFHGTAYYYGRYPWASAVSDRQFRTVNLDRQQMYGGTVGNPILKNRLFNFVSFEGWKWNQAATPYNATLPTDLERTGNFSQSVNAAGGLNAIYDPWSTVTSADGSTITRTPFPGNIIPGSRQDPIAAKFMGALWKPNRPGQGYDHLNNYSVSLPVQYPYKNFADRVDFHTNKLTLTGRIQLFRTPVQTSNPTGSSVFVSNRGSERDGTTYSGTATYTLNSTTVISMSGDYHNFVDASRYPTQASEWTFAGLYPNSTFYKALYADPGIAVLQARMSISGDGGRWVDMGPGGGFWDQRPKGNGFDAKIAQQRGSHYLKAGFETLGTFAPSVLQQSNPGFGFNGDITNSTYVNPNMAVSGNPYASFLLGAVVPVGASASGWDSNETSMPSLIIPTTSTRFFGGYINDDFKINKDLTLNLGLRYEFEQPYMEDQNRLTAPLDLTKPIPELQGVQMPAGVKQFYTGSWTMNGAFQFTTSGHPGAWNAGLGTLSPRIGAAYRLNDKTSLRAGYGRYVTPWNMNSAVSDQFSAPYTGFANYTDAAPTVQGVPQMQLSNPFTSAFPIVPSYGKSYGAYTGLGGGLTYFNADRPRAYSNRFNFSVQRQLPQSIILDVTYFLNLSNRITTVNYDINQVDPRIALQYGAATNVQVANPFYHLPIPNQSPGALWNQATVSALTLARPYPQYSGALTVLDGVSGGDMIYHSLQIKGVKSFSSGYTLLVAYNYHLQTNKQFYDNVDNYLKNWTDEDSGTPRHRITASGTWALPVGKGRKFMTNAPRVLDFLIGGWNLAGTETWHSGTLLNFGGMLVSGDPTISNPGPNGWFNTSVFKQLPAYTRRTNPWYYSNIRGPKYFNIDGTISKDFHVTERIRLQLHMDAFNAINNMNYNNPNMSVTSSQFGKSTDIYSQDFGRRLQLGLRLEF